jgi:hypothetical protein
LRQKAKKLSESIRGLLSLGAIFCGLIEKTREIRRVIRMSGRGFGLNKEKLVPCEILVEPKTPPLTPISLLISLVFLISLQENGTQTQQTPNHHPKSNL